LRRSSIVGPAHKARARSYGEGFALDVRSDMKLETLLERSGATSLSRLIKKR
jgi:hypothetical protein